MARARRPRSTPGSVRRTPHDGAPRYRSILDSIPDGIVWLGPDWTYTFVNARGAELLGRDPADLLGKNYWDEHPEDWSAFAEAYQHCMSTREPVVFEDHYEPWDRWFENRVFPTGDGGIAILFTDVTEQKHLEEELRRYALRLEAIHDVDREILAAGSVQRIGEVVVRRARALVPCDRASLLIYEPGDQVRVVAIDPLPDPAAIGAVAPAGLIGVGGLDLSAPWLFLPDLGRRPGQTEEQRRFWLGVEGAIAVPLRADGTPVGLLGVVSSDPGVMNDRNGEVLRELADRRRSRDPAGRAA